MLPITVGSHIGSRGTALWRDWLPSGTGRDTTTCDDVYAGAGCEESAATYAMQEVKIIFNIEIYL